MNLFKANGKKTGVSAAVKQNFTKDQVDLVKDVITKSDQVVVDIFHFMNKTLDAPSKQEIVVYRKAILNLLNQKNDEKFKYIYDIASKSVYQQKEEEERIQLELKNDVVMSPNIFMLSWSEITKNIQNSFLDSNDLTPESLKNAFLEEHRRLAELRAKINKMIQLGFDVANPNELEIQERTFLKLTDLVNIFLSENFQDVGAMVQEIEVFEKRYNLDKEETGSVFLDANYKTITNLTKPKFPGDAANKSYVDDRIDELSRQVASLSANAKK
ncbi:hypothetical protein J2Z62_000039 [Mycoplasmoides fastidiosum]|uniref:Uncharacterized protein n=1 Tax=Mycoplasmoides fastidiosum TaxID=92758 RepID=A0ABU0LY06_9BACT|nr:hypothetical protein [Mycoplasmoides fastidiosum]MDQ0513601.1 hypothetical protein [Mycoplasmoides fastidiosum]UUD37976.1 hypothetical protein NPA10_01100 [Mycoplasmoides fastidiosum]